MHPPKVFSIWWIQYSFLIFLLFSFFSPTINNLITLLSLLSSNQILLFISLFLKITLFEIIPITKTASIKMETNLPVISKRVWSLVRVAFFMLRKGISKGKLMMNFNMILKRHSKLAGKAIANLVSHHPHHGGSTSSRHSHDSHHQFTSSREYEFSCSNTPYHFFSIGKRHHSHNHRHNTRAHSAHDDELKTMNAMKAVLEILNNDQAIVEASPTHSPMVRQLRVTDSPFPIRDDDEKDNQVDKAAEDFIKKFYSQLRMQD